MSLQTFTYDGQYTLESGDSLPGFQLGYHTYGSLHANTKKVVWVCHALTANSDVFEWWPGLFGTNDLYNPQDYFIVCANNLGSCYGSTGPLSVNPQTGEPWYDEFPFITIRDMVRALDLLRIHLGIDQVHTIIGGSQGAQLVLEWNALHPALFEHTIVVATNAKHSPWGIAFNESQRLAILADDTYYSKSPSGGQKGLAAARSIALLSYRNYHTYTETQQEDHHESVTNFKASSYQRYQGNKLVNRFNAYSYIVLANAMDSHNLGRGRASVQTALQSILAKTLVIGIISDLLFPPVEQKCIADYIPRSRFALIDSFYGHDGFLIEAQQLSEIIHSFYHQEINIEKNIHQQLITT